MKTHLSDEQFGNVWMGCATPDVVEHVAHCAACHREVVLFARRISELRNATLHLSEQLERNRKQIQVRRMRPKLAWGAALATVLGLAVILPTTTGLLKHESSLQRSDEQSSPSKVSAESVQIAKDNALLAAVHGELSEEVPLALQPLMPPEVSMQARR